MFAGRASADRELAPLEKRLEARRTRRLPMGRRGIAAVSKMVSGSRRRVRVCVVLDLVSEKRAALPF